MTGEWESLDGDGTDAVPPVGTAYEARLRDGRVWRGLRITPFCVSLGADLFRHRGASSDPVAIRVIGTIA